MLEEFTTKDSKESEVTKLTIITVLDTGCRLRQAAV
jgi:hypothetical protein